MTTKHTNNKTETQEQELRQFEDFIIEGQTVRIYTDEKSKDFHKLSVFVTPYDLAQIKFKEIMLYDLICFYLSSKSLGTETAYDKARGLQILAKEGNRYVDLNKFVNLPLDDLKIIWRRFQLWGMNIYDMSLWPSFEEILKGAAPTQEMLNTQKYFQELWDPFRDDHLPSEQWAANFKRVQALAELEREYQLRKIATEMLV
jgi:hypothetical protein